MVPTLGSLGLKMTRLGILQSPNVKKGYIYKLLLTILFRGQSLFQLPKSVWNCQVHAKNSRKKNVLHLVSTSRVNDRLSKHVLHLRIWSAIWGFDCFCTFGALDPAYHVAVVFAAVLFVSSRDLSTWWEKMGLQFDVQTSDTWNYNNCCWCYGCCRRHKDCAPVYKGKQLSGTPPLIVRTPFTTTQTCIIYSEWLS